VKYKDPEALRPALEARLRQPFDVVGDLSRRRTVAFDRLLARLAVAGHDAWLLEGGAALEFRMPERARATRNVDLALTDGRDPADLLLDDLAVETTFTRRGQPIPGPGLGSMADA